MGWVWGDGAQVHSVPLEDKQFIKHLHGRIKKIGNILVVLQIRHTKNATVQDDLYEGYWLSFKTRWSHPKLFSALILGNIQNIQIRASWRRFSAQHRACQKLSSSPAGTHRVYFMWLQMWAIHSSGGRCTGYGLKGKQGSGGEKKYTQ